MVLLGYFGDLTVMGGICPGNISIAARKCDAGYRGGFLTKIGRRIIVVEEPIGGTDPV